MRTIGTIRAVRRIDILEALEEEPGLRLHEITERLRLETAEIAPLLWQMSEDREIVRAGSRWYLG